MRIRSNKNSKDIVENSKYIIINPNDNKGKWNKVFNNNNPIHLEIGMGKGDFIIDMAQNNPDINFIGLEKYTQVISKACAKLIDKEITNLKLINIDALNLNDIFDKEIDVIYLNFSDPWPKKRTAKRRLTSEIFLNIYDNIFKKNKDIYMKTDNTNLFEYSVISLTNHGYIIDDISLDLWSTDKTYSETEYEHKFRTKGVKINYLHAINKFKN